MNNLLSFDQPRRWLIQDKQVWLRLLIIMAALLFSATVPLIVPKRFLLPLVMLLPAIGVVLIFMRWPPLGFIAIFVAGMTVPFDGRSGFNISILIVALMLGLWLADMVVRQREIKVVASSVVPPLLAFVVVSLLAFAVGQLPWYIAFQAAPLGAQLGGLSIFVLSVAAFLLVASQIRDLRWLKAMTWVFLVMGALYIAVQLAPRSSTYVLRPLFQGGAFESLFYVWLVSLALGQALFNGELRPVWRVALVGLVVATFMVTFGQFNGWKSGWVPALVSIIAIIGFRSWRTGVIMLLIGAILVGYLATDGVASDEYSYTTRIDAWLIMAEITKVNPVLGLGPANYRWYTPLYRIRGYNVAFNSHNQYVDQIAQTGLLGLFCLLLFFGQLGRLSWRLRQRAPAGFARAYVYAAFGGLCGMVAAGMLGDWILPFFYNIGMRGFRTSVVAWLFLGGLVVIEKIYRESCSNTGQSVD